MNLNDSILKTLKETYLLAAAELALFPEGSPEYKRAQSTAANTSRTVFELFGSPAADALREEGLREWNRIHGAA